MAASTHTRRTHLAALLLCLAALSGCMRPRETEDERIRRQAAEDTRQVRRDARVAGTVARQEARKVGQQARDIVAGVREGWHDGAPAGSSAKRPGSVDVNSASAAELADLPGISIPEAKRIVRKRPYRTSGDLVRRGLLTQAQYDRIANRLVAATH